MSVLRIIRPPSKFVYRVNNPSGLAILTQLRVGLSNLNFYKFKHNFRDSLDLLCSTNDGVEDTEHYLLLCHTYNESRINFLSSVNAISLPHGFINLSNDELLKRIIYGHEQLPFDSSAKILTATIEYVQASKRFE